jgi:tripartite-type tricarboxylate transporter receptor subunit TctC
MIKRRNLDRGLLGGVALAALPAFPRGALAAFPDRVITLVVPFAPGGNTDLGLPPGGVEG